MEPRKNRNVTEFTDTLYGGWIGALILLALITIVSGIIDSKFSVVKKFNTKFGPTIYGNNPRV